MTSRKPWYSLERWGPISLALLILEIGFRRWFRGQIPTTVSSVFVYLVLLIGSVIAFLHFHQPRSEEELTRADKS